MSRQLAVAKVWVVSLIVALAVLILAGLLWFGGDSASGRSSAATPDGSQHSSTTVGGDQPGRAGEASRLVFRLLRDMPRMPNGRRSAAVRALAAWPIPRPERSGLFTDDRWWTASGDVAGAAEFIEHHMPGSLVLASAHVTGTGARAHATLVFHRSPTADATNLGLVVIVGVHRQGVAIRAEAQGSVRP